MTFAPKHTAAMVRHFAKVYRDGKHAEASPEETALVKGCTEFWFKQIPVPVTWTQETPYDTWEQMAADIDRGRFMVTCDGFYSNIFHSHYQRFRAVHDYFGHYLAQQHFGLIGELGCFGVHTGMYPEACWPMIFNELILVNSFKDFFGKYSCEDKLVRVPSFGMPVGIAS